MTQTGSKNAKMPLVLGGLAVVAGYVMIWRPQSSSIDEARQDRRQAEQQLVDLQRVGTATTVVVEAADGSMRQLLLTAVPSAPELATLLRQLQAIATETNMVMGSMTPSPLTANPAGPGGSVQISIGASGSREAADTYLGRLRDLERLLVIEQLSVQERAERRRAGHRRRRRRRRYGRRRGGDPRGAGAADDAGVHPRRPRRPDRSRHP